MVFKLVGGSADPVYIVQEVGNDVRPVSAINPLSIAPTASELHLGQVGGEGTTVTVNPVLTVAGAYIAGDFVGTSAAAIAFANAVRVAGGSGVIESAVLIDAALQSASCELWLFDTAVTPPADNAAWTISDGNAATCIGVIPFSTYYASALNSVSTAEGLNIAFSAAATATYAGPGGARLVFDVMLAAEGLAAARDAWERGNVYLQ